MGMRETPSSTWCDSEIPGCDAEYAPRVPDPEGETVGFLDKAKAAASDLAAKADTALSNSGMGGGPDPATLYRDLGRMTYDEHAGRPVDPEAKARILAELAALEQQGRLAAVGPPPPPPPPPGTAPAAPPPPQSAADG